MAENKKSVLLYCDIIHTVNELSDDEAGRLFKHYLAYINNLDPEPPDKITKIVFEPIKQNLLRDLEKWQIKSERNKEIAKAGWEKRKDANACERTKPNANNADKVTDKDKVKDTVTDNDNDILLKKETKQEEQNFNFPKSELEIAFDKFVEMRKKQKKPPTDHAIDLLKKKIKLLSNGNEQLAIEIINQSILNSWQDVFPLRQNQIVKNTTENLINSNFKPRFTE